MFSKILIIILLSLSTSVVYARWATAEDSGIELLQMNRDFMVYSDGTSEQGLELESKILNEQGRAVNSIIRIYYTKPSSTLEILKAKTFVDGQEYILATYLIEDKPIASSISGFDQTNQMLLAFPNVKIGANLYLKYKRKTLKTAIDGLFETYLSYDNYNLKSSVTCFKSELPLYLEYNDPNNYLDIKQSKSGKYYFVKVTLKKPVHIAIADEPKSLLASQKYPWIHVTTLNDWQDYGNKITEPFIKATQQPLPDLYKNIAAAANTEQDPIKKINTVMAMLNDNVQYMGDWTTIAGKYAPKDLAQVASNRLGDCKDFATGTVAILNSLGIKASVALVWRGKGTYDYSDLKLPGNIHFNHAVVKVSLGVKDLWVDPTNFVITSDKILPDIADREALVLYANNSKLEQIPASQSDDAKMTTQRVMDLSNPSLIAIKGFTLLEGLAAANFTGFELTRSINSIKYDVLKSQGSVHNMFDTKVILPNLKSRIVSDLKFDFEFKEQSKIIKTNAGCAIWFAGIATDYYIFNDQVSDMYLGIPRIIRDITTLVNITTVNSLPLNCIVSSPWIDAKRTVTYAKDSVIVEQEFTIKQSWIANEVLKSAEFKKFSNDLVKNFKEGISIVFIEKYT